LGAATARKHLLADVVDQLSWVKRIGFLIVATCGILLASAKACDAILGVEIPRSAG